MGRRARIAIVLALVLALVWTGLTALARHIEFQPGGEVAAPVWTGTPPREVSVTTADGLTLHGYYWPAGAARDIIILFHGNADSQQAMASRALPFADGGHGVLVASYRGYGGNPGGPSAPGLLIDGDAWIARARTLLPRGGRLYLFGHSLGSGVALAIAARHPVDGVATLGAFTRVSDMAPWYARPFIADEFDNVAAMHRITARVALFHGDRDEVIPFDNMAGLFAASRGRAHMVPLPGEGHFVPLTKMAPMVWALLDPPPPPPGLGWL